MKLPLPPHYHHKLPLSNASNKTEGSKFEREVMSENMPFLLFTPVTYTHHYHALPFFTPSLTLLFYPAL